MHYQANDLKPEDILTFMRAEFEGLDSIIDIDEGMYDALGDFAIYLRDGINKKSLSDEKFNKALKIMNTMGASNNLEVQNLLVVGIFEILTDEDDVVSSVKCGLTGPASEMFERVLVGWNND